MAYQLDDIEYDEIGDFMEAYFQRGAEILLGHSEHKPAFFVNTDIESTSEIELAIQNGIKLPALILDTYEDDLQDTTGSHTQRLSSAISVISTYDQGNARHIRQVRSECRQIARKFVMQMRRDLLKGDPFHGVLVENNIFLEKGNLPGTYLGCVSGLFTGWTYQFTWYTPDSILFGRDDFE